MFLTRPTRTTRSRISLSRMALLASVAFLGPLTPDARAQGQDARLELSTSSDAAKEHFWAGVNDAQNVFPARAAMHFEMALEADPDFGLAKVFHGFVNPGVAGAARQAEIAEGLAAMAGASTNEILVAIALREWSAGNAPAASRMFETASALMPADPHIASYATQLAGARGDQTDLITRWQSLSAAFPELAAPHNNIAYQQWARGNQAGAMASVQTYVEMVPDHPNAHDSYAELLQWGGHYRQALDEYNTAAELDANFDQAYIGAAEVLFLVGQEEQAREQIALGIEHAPSTQARIAGIRAMANTYMVDGDSDNAMAQLGRAVSEAETAGLNGAAALSHEQAALTSGVMGNGRFVEEHLAEAVELRGSENPLHLGVRGLAYAAAGEGAIAREASDRLAAATNAPFWQSMSRAINAMVYLQEDQTEMAMEELSEANPGDPIVQALLAQCYDNMNLPMAAAAQRANVTGNRQINLANPFVMYALVLASDR